MDSRSFNKTLRVWKADFRKRVDDDSQCCLSCFNATTYEDSCLNFLFLIVANELATKIYGQGDAMVAALNGSIWRSIPASLSPSWGRAVQAKAQP